MRWPIISLADTTEIFISGGTPDTKNAEFWSGDIPWITSADISDDGQVTIGRRYINMHGLKNSATNIVPKGSILLVTRTGVGKIAIAPVDIAISQDFTGIVLKKAFIPSFVLLAIKSQMNKLIAAQRGVTIKGVTREDVKRIPIPLVASSEQHRIVEILERADILRKKRVDADAKAERILPALFYKMFGDPITNPQKWKMVKLSKVCRINPPANISNLLDDTPVSFIPMADVDEKWGIIIGTQVKPLHEVRRGFTPFIEGDIIFAKITPCMENGKIAIATNLQNGIAFGSTEFHVLRPGPEAVSEWVYALVRLDVFRKYAKSYFTGTAGQQRVPSDFLINFKAPVPSLQLQKRFAASVKNFYKWVSNARISTHKINDLFMTFLYSAFSGSLTAKWRKYHMKELLVEMEEQAKYLKSAKLENA